jgi:regulator of protease activity HflC (stomatin/prohibitin superfamily)
MSDPADDDRSGSGPTTGVTVNWRGVVENGTPEPKSVRAAHSMRRTLSAALVALGLTRKRRADGTLAPRPWGRVVAIWGGLLVLVALVSAGHVIGAGDVGIPVTLGDAGDPIESGLHFTLPWPFARVTQMSVRTQNYTMSAAAEGDLAGSDDSVVVLGRDGAQANVDATVLYRLDRDRATEVYETLGTNYRSSLIRPSARSCIRTEFTDRGLVEASTEAWTEISERISECMRDKIEPRGIILEDFQLRDVRLSPQVQQAVEAKVAANETSGVELSDAFLRFAYIQALRELATSSNSKTVVVPSDSGLTPTVPLTGSESLVPEGATP